jgi:uncharacterized metal-binding protein
VYISYVYKLLILLVLILSSLFKYVVHSDCKISAEFSFGAVLNPFVLRPDLDLEAIRVFTFLAERSSHWTSRWHVLDS